MKDDGEGFLSRWAKRKAEARAEPATESEALETTNAPGAGAIADAEPEEAFDVSTLPPVEELTKDSDFTVFMQKGVPPSLKKAALQKMWMSDPAIRDYIGLSEMSWDFNSGEVFHGYGALSPLAKVADMVRDIAEGYVSPLPAEDAGPNPETLESESDPALSAEAAAAAELTKRSAEVDAASQHQVVVIQNDTEFDHKTARRRHGSAIPS